jgi:hypothetical protein
LFTSFGSSISSEKIDAGGTAWKVVFFPKGFTVHLTDFWLAFAFSSLYQLCVCKLHATGPGLRFFVREKFIGKINLLLGLTRLMLLPDAFVGPDPFSAVRNGFW